MPISGAGGRHGGGVQESFLSTEHLPAAERYAWWQETVAGSSTPTAITSPFRTDFRASSRQLHLGPARISVLCYPPMEVHRSAALIRRSDPGSYHLAYAVHGGRSMEFGRSIAHCREGEFLFHDSSHPYRARSTGDGDGDTRRFIHVDLPREVLALPRRLLDGLVGTSLPGATGPGALLAGYLRQTTVQDAPTSEQRAARLGTVTVDLLTALLAHHLDAVEAAEQRHPTQTLLASACAFIDQHLADPTLSTAKVASAHHIAPRTLQLAFQHHGESVSAWIRRRRLERCRRDLAEPLLDGQSIEAVATRWGFRYPQAFSRAFRSAYGESPRDCRERHRALRRTHR